jgi:hypothetical protein
MPVTRTDAYEPSNEEIDDIVSWHQTLGIWADDLNDLINLRATRLLERSQGQAVSVRCFPARIEWLLAKLVSARRRRVDLSARTSSQVGALRASTPLADG